MIFLTGHGDVPTAVAAVKRGAFDFVEKPFSDNALVDRVVQALQVSADAIARRRAQQALQRALADLTEREREVMARVVAGLSEQADRRRTGHQRAHGGSAPRPLVRQDARALGRRAGQPAARAGRLSAGPAASATIRAMALGEFDLIQKYFTRPTPQAVLGVGDDCALLQPSAGMQWAISSDMLVEGRHFLSTVRPERLGHKALAVNLSDLAACGAKPVAFTLALALPRPDEAFLAGLAQGLFDLADAHGIGLVGGDTTAGPLNICITVFGEVPPGQALRRDGARAGDALWVSHPLHGGLGDARLALEAFRGHVSLGAADFEAVRAAMEQPQPRVALGLGLRGLASAAIDLSDGLVGDLGHVLRRSGVGAVIRLDSLPISPVLARQPRQQQWQCALAGGDDYELLFSAPAAASAAVQAAATAAGVGVRRIGTLTAAPGLQLLDGEGQPVPLQLQGFDHFAAGQ